jgi:hypothetical protein
MGDKAVPSATERAWKELIGLQALLKAKRILATVGNHDVDSRHHHNNHDAKGVLLDLSPGFPFADEGLKCQFWTYHFAILTDEATKVRFLILNSSAYHGESQDEFQHGRVSPRTIERIKRALVAMTNPPLNILVCHHHPQKHDELKLGEYDDMKGGADLLRLLASPDFGPWLIFHGHKHHPKISYAQGGNCTPLVFSVGSCAAILGPELQGHARNQAYLVRVNVPTNSITTCSGEFRSWDWAPGAGWQLSKADSGLPATGGFGYRGDLGALAQQIADSFPTGGRWKEIVSDLPAIRTLLPSDCQNLCYMLKKVHDFRIEEGKDGTPILIEK